jgi:hypothetical protein
MQIAVSKQVRPRLLTELQASADCIIVVYKGVNRNLLENEPT